MIKFVDAFAGIGGFRLGIERASSDLDINVQCVESIEWDEQCQITYARNFLTIPKGDITSIDLNAIPDHDLLVGGFPCQPFSRNGKFYNKNNRTIGEDIRANLFMSLVDILQSKQPRAFVFENVKGLLAMKNQDGTPVLDTILQNLVGCGYRVDYRILDSADFGLPQQRKRIFFIGVRNDVDMAIVWPTNMLRDTCIGDILETTVPAQYHLDYLWRNRTILNGVRVDSNAKPNHPFAKGHSRLKVLQYIYDKAIKPIEKTHEIESVAILYGDTPSGLPRQQDKIYSIWGIAPTIATFSIPCVDSSSGLRQLTPRECARLQGFPDSYYLYEEQVSVAYRQIGNAVSVPVVAAIMRNLLSRLASLNSQLSP